MSSLNALMVAIDAAMRKRDEARRTLQARAQACQSAQAQMDQLQDYAAQMQQRWGAHENQAVQPEVMYHQYQFMERLNHAMGLQTKVIQDHAIRLEAAQKALMACELRVTSLQKVVAARQRDISLAQMRREQKQTDERAALQFIGRTFGLQFQEA
ncbi:flagellar export protein FliJ [Comamonas endophytica]|uniref:Flagellar FliJ protein n=1 Tax=Comamonas endophytica TaxID=2949090 RepID=A0ABY6GF00_9BURK|nr:MULTISPECIES: flagellar export protein FliJ [unclassified Acidovorax]MCD2512749.1 flagellar export protein FliJ [Acidovorax sp. D4N7]UYG52900.1 flagellar export protein FliJ [Acidovorax sp. 5MLIR]